MKPCKCWHGIIQIFVTSLLANFCHSHFEYLKFFFAISRCFRLLLDLLIKHNAIKLSVAKINDWSSRQILAQPIKKYDLMFSKVLIDTNFNFFFTLRNPNYSMKKQNMNNSKRWIFKITILWIITSKQCRLHYVAV